MYTLEGTTITIPYGDSADIKFEITDTDTGSALVLENGQRLVFEVYAINSTQQYMHIAVDSSSKQSDNTYLIPVLPAHTRINRNKYRYMLRITDEEENTVDTIAGYKDELYLNIG